MSLLIFHASVLVINIYALWYDQMYVDLPLPEGVQKMPFKARWIFLTFWCLILQTVYFAIALVNDLIGTNSTAPSKTPHGLKKIKDTIFSLSFPVALYVGTVFWTLYYINKDFIFPDNVEKLFPKWSNHVMHTTIVPFILIELIFSRRNYPSRPIGLTLGFVFMLGYISWINYLYFTKNVWAYPFLDVLNWANRIIFFIVSIILGLLVYLLGEKLNYLVSPSSKTCANGAFKQQ